MMFFRKGIYRFVVFFSVMITGCVSLGQNSYADIWLDDYEQALTKARKKGRYVLANFTGSDWCGWCIKLDKEVFGKTEFARWANDTVILLKLDYPRRKKLPDAIVLQNEKLKDKYKITSYPTILFLDPHGEVVGKHGYEAGGPSVWLQSATAILSEQVSVTGRPKGLPTSLKTILPKYEPYVFPNNNDPPVIDKDTVKVYLKNGGVLQGQIVSEDDTKVILELGASKVHVQQERILRIEDL